jgi:hypothetical protein
MRKVTIDSVHVWLALDRDTSFEAYDQHAYLDIETGDVFWVYENDEQGEFDSGVSAEENSRLRDRVSADPHRHIEFPELDHGNHHELLREFLASEWTDDKQLHADAAGAYRGSIGGWKENLRDQQKTLAAWEAYKDERLTARLREHMQRHGVDLTVR